MSGLNKNVRWPAFLLALLGAVSVAATRIHSPAPKAVLPVVTIENTGIRFDEGNWASIVKKARAEKKIIFLDAYASWCGPCKLMQKHVFTRADVAEVFNSNFINVKVDMERGEGPQLARLFPLEAYPTLFFIEPGGKVIRKVVGYRSAEDLISIGKGIPPVR